MEGQRIDVSNTDRLREIVSEHGWPGRSLVGEEGAHHAWLIAQHADRQLDFQRQALELLADAVQRGEAAQRDWAYLTDRVRMNEGREQVYGTQIPARRQLVLLCSMGHAAPEFSFHGSGSSALAPSSTTRSRETSFA